MNKQAKEDAENFKRMIYMWRRYEGIRDVKHGKIWLSYDITKLELLIRNYFRDRNKFDWDRGCVKEEENDA